ncbi:hypothetical protein HNO89_000200 [Sporosarcina luteola]|nr:hypothetical protein [Sporosarcina luteola]
MDNIKDTVKSIPLPEGLHKRAKMGVAQVKKNRKNRWIYPAAASVFLASSISVGATMNEGINNLVSIVSPELAILLQPINRIAEDEGVKMEVIAAMQDEDMAVIYVTMQGIDGNPIDETLDVYDFSISKGRSFTNQTVHYDKETNTATVRFLSFGGDSANKLKLNIRTLLTNKEIFEDVAIPVDLTEIPQQQVVELPEDTIRGAGGPGGGIDTPNMVLAAGNLNIQTPYYDKMKITNVGIQDDRLYIQTEWTANDAIDHAQFFLVNAKGEKIKSTKGISYGRDETGAPVYNYNYEEIIFDVKDLNLADYQLQSKIYSYGDQVNGKWEATFKLNEMKGRSIPFTEDFAGWKAEKVIVSPLGLTILGKGAPNKLEDMTTTISMDDGTLIEMTSVVSHSENNHVKMKWTADKPLETEHIKVIYINGIEVNL